jgi:hypothetical protein
MFSHRRTLLAAPLLLCPLLSSAQRPGNAQLSGADTQNLDQGRSAMRGLLEDFKKLQSEPIPSSPGAAALVLRRASAWTKEYYEDYRDLRRKTINPNLARYFGRIARTLQELSETAIVGATLLDAVQTSNASLLQGVSEAIAYSEARRLAAPVSSRLELQTRVREFQSLMERKSIEMETELNLAWKQLKEVSGIEF